MLLVIVAVGIIIAAIFLMRPQRPAPSHPVAVQDDTDMRQETDEMTNAMTGMILSYLVSNFLIDSHQYEDWRGLAPEQLKNVLAKAGIMKEAEFDSFSQQLLTEEHVQETQEEFSSAGTAQDYNEARNSVDFGSKD